jgi:hypothetical protein
LADDALNPLPDASKRPVFAFRESLVVTAETELTQSVANVAPLPGTYSEHALTGPAPKGDALRRAVRGDLAHVRYAGQVFVSHYAVPVSRTVGADGATLHAAGRSESDVIAQLGAGEVFNLLDISGGWGWGQQGDQGWVGYLPMTALTAL